MLTDEQIKKFQAIYRKEFKEEIDRQEAIEKGEKLIRLFKVIYQPITKNENEKYRTGEQR